MKVLVLNPPFFPMYSRQSRSPAVTKSSTLYYPYFLAYCAGVLEQEERIEVKLIDAPAFNWNHKRVYSFIKEFKPDLLVSDTTTGSIYNDIEVVTKIKELSKAFTVLVGPHVSATTEETLKIAAIDAIARREYEFIVRDLAILIRNNPEHFREKLTTIDGLSFHNEKDKTIHNPDRPFIDDLDSLPFVSKVYKKHLNDYIDKYFYGANLYPVMTILSGRGCPYHCVYCVQPQTFSGHKYRIRSIQNVVDEMEYISEVFPNIRDIFLEDDSLTVNRKRARELAQEIINRNLKLTWSTNSRADCDYETLAIMKESGCRLLCVGFESSDQKILDNIGKKIKVEQIHDFMNATKKVGMLVHGCFLVGCPGETKETLQKTLELALKINPDTVQFYPIMVYPGTTAYKWAKENGYLKTEDYQKWLTPEGLHNSVVITPYITDKELVGFCNYARRRFYLRPSYITRKVLQAIFDPKERKRIYRASGTFIKFILKNSCSSIKVK